MVLYTKEYFRGCQVRATEFISEIARMYGGDYTGGKGELSHYTTPRGKVVKPLPGGSGLQYAIQPGDDTSFVYIIDPTAKPSIVAKLSLEHVDLAIPNSVQVGSITVDEDYRGRGLAKALYGIVLTVMGKTLVAGGEQTPGGRRNWVSLVNIPGVEVKGFVQLDDEEVNPHDAWADEDKVDKTHDILMQLGGQFVGQNRFSEIWAFDVVPGRGELKPAIRTKLNQLYDDYGSEPTGLFARWVG